MTKNKLLIVAVIVAALFGFKALFPKAAGEIISGVREVFSRDINYREVLRGIESSVEAFRSDDDEEEAELQIPSPETLIVEHGSTNYAELAAELGDNEGEDSDIMARELPEAVTAFLESQEPYEDIELPENVSYDYRDFPEEFCVPVVGYNSSGFGYRTHPIHGDLRFHYGSDFAAWSGEDIFAFADGTVSFAGYSDSYGNYITIDHTEGWQSLYAHCSILYVETGDAVESGDKIALVGSTGLVTGPHLHFELSRDGVYTNPEYYVN